MLNIILKMLEKMSLDNFTYDKVYKQGLILIHQLI